MNTALDSTSNDNDLSERGGISTTTGKIGSCYTFDGTDDFLTDTWTPPLKITVEAWWNSDVKNSISREIVCIRNGPTYCNAVLETQATNVVAFTGGSPDWEIATIPSTSWTAGTWYYIVGTAQKSDYAKIYLNGTFQVQSPGTRANDLDATANTEFCIGQRGGTAPHNQDKRWDGKIDEVRISDLVRSAEWISTEYTNQQDPSNFLSVGPEEPGP
jgi:hypothetical protein